MNTQSNSEALPPTSGSPSSMEEATSLAREAFEEWMRNPSGNSATANLRNKLCVVIGEREDLKAQLAALDADYGKLERQYSEACKALMVCDGAMMGKVKPSSVAFKMINAILRPENACVHAPGATEPKLK